MKREVVAIALIVILLLVSVYFGILYSNAADNAKYLAGEFLKAHAEAQKCSNVTQIYPDVSKPLSIHKDNVIIWLYGENCTVWFFGSKATVVSNDQFFNPNYPPEFFLTSGKDYHIIEH